MAGKKQKQEGVGAWIAIVILFAVGLWPIALVMLLVKLFGNDGQKRRFGQSLERVLKFKNLLFFI